VDKLTPSLLARAFNGQLVPQDPNDEPASVLLARIRSDTNGGKKPARAKSKT
jgi:type I restriction enzyme, S subunit